MLTVQTPGAFSNCWPYLDPNILHDATPFKVAHSNPLMNTTISPSPITGTCHRALQRSSFFSTDYTAHKRHHLSYQSVSKIWLCRSHESISPGNEYRSSRNIAITLFTRYRNFVDRGGGDNLKEFISAGVNAYALGCTDEGLRKELTALKESGFQIETMQSYGVNTSLKSKIFSVEVDECILWLSIISITILCTPQPTIVRWSPTPPVTEEMMLKWKGFCAIIANAYYVRGMAWLPVKTLQMEQMAVVGCAEEPSVVASRMRLVFSTLEVVSPQWPRV